MAILLAIWLLLWSLLPACSPSPSPLSACAKTIANDVVSVSSLDLTPDGQYLAVIHRSTYSLHLKVIELETGRLLVDADDFHHTLPSGSQAIRAVKWLDDGRRLLYGGGRIIRELEIVTGKVTLVAACQDCWGFDLLPDRRTAVVAVGASFAALVEVRDMLGAEPGRMLVETSSAGVPMPSWSPDGKRVAYSNGERIHIYDLVSRQALTLEVQWRNGVSPTWLSDVEVLLPDALNSALWRVNVVTGQYSLVADVQSVNSRVGRIVSVLGSRDGQFLVVQPERGNTLIIVDTSCLLRP
ncbi:MAG: hypothetical protein M1546_22650 [Chloroflexi bacterium]|nr:hypothetical protein [Chloroflexota bacterium]